MKDPLNGLTKEQKNKRTKQRRRPINAAGTKQLFIMFITARVIQVGELTTIMPAASNALTEPFYTRNLRVNVFKIVRNGVRAQMLSLKLFGTDAQVFSEQTQWICAEYEAESRAFVKSDGVEAAATDLVVRRIAPILNFAILEPQSYVHNAN